MHFNPYGGLAAELAARLVNAPPDQELTTLLGDAGYKPLGTMSLRQEAVLRRWIVHLDAVFRGQVVRTR